MVVCPRCSCNPCHVTCEVEREAKPTGEVMQALECARRAWERTHHVQSEIPGLTNDPRDGIVVRVKSTEGGK